MAIQINKAERRAVKVKLAVTGPTGSGKTLSSLYLAKGLGKKIGYIDTENGSASLYSDKFDFDVYDLKAPFTTEKYIEAIREFERLGYDVLIIDSITHSWSGEGGLLAQKEQMDQRGGNAFSHWGKITQKHEAFKSVLMQSGMHLICTMRSKMEYAQVAGDNGKLRVQKLGLAPQQRDGIEYDFSVVFDIAMNHEAEASKDRTGIFGDSIFKITTETGEKISEWLLSAKQPSPATSKLVENEQQKNTQKRQENKQVEKNKQEVKQNEGKVATKKQVKVADKIPAVGAEPRPPVESVDTSAIPEALRDEEENLDAALGPDDRKITAEEAQYLRDFGKQHGWTVDDIGHTIYKFFKLIRWGEMTETQYIKLQKHITENSN